MDGTAKSTAIEILELRRKVAGLTLPELARKSGVAYQRLWRARAGSAVLSELESEYLTKAFADAEQERDDARTAIAVLSVAYSA